jgi:uncharacterized protein YndB with AHSA1/START domain
VPVEQPPSTLDYLLLYIGTVPSGIWHEPLLVSVCRSIARVISYRPAKYDLEHNLAAWSYALTVEDVPMRRGKSVPQGQWVLTMVVRAEAGTYTTANLTMHKVLRDSGDAMEEETNRAAAHKLTRRRAIALASCGLTAGYLSLAESAAQTMQEIPATAGNKTRTSLHEDIELKTTPQRIYEALLDAKQFAAFSGVPATIEPKAGGAFSMFGGQIVGRTIELVPNQRIVQAWRPTHWDPGIYSIVEFQLKPGGSGALVALDHKGFPEGEFDHLEWGWHAHYWEPLKKFLA